MPRRDTSIHGRIVAVCTPPFAEMTNLEKSLEGGVSFYYRQRGTLHPLQGDLKCCIIFLVHQYASYLANAQRLPLRSHQVSAESSPLRSPSCATSLPGPRRSTKTPHLKQRERLCFLPRQPPPVGVPAMGFPLRRPRMQGAKKEFHCRLRRHTRRWGLQDMNKSSLVFKETLHPRVGPGPTVDGDANNVVTDACLIGRGWRFGRPFFCFEERHQNALRNP